MGGMEECTVGGREDGKGVGTCLCICRRKISGVSQLEAG